MCKFCKINNYYINDNDNNSDEYTSIIEVDDYIKIYNNNDEYICITINNCATFKKMPIIIDDKNRMIGLDLKNLINMEVLDKDIINNKINNISIDNCINLQKIHNIHEIKSIDISNCNKLEYISNISNINNIHILFCNNINSINNIWKINNLYINYYYNITDEVYYIDNKYTSINNIINLYDINLVYLGYCKISNIIDMRNIRRVHFENEMDEHDIYDNILDFKNTIEDKDISEILNMFIINENLKKNVILEIDETNYNIINNISFDLRTLIN